MSAEGTVYVVACRTHSYSTSQWKNMGTTIKEPSEETAHSIITRGNHTPPEDPELYSEDGIEMRFLPIGGGEPKTFRLRYELDVTEITLEEADAAALPSLDPEHEEIEF